MQATTVPTSHAATSGVTRPGPAEHHTSATAGEEAPDRVPDHRVLVFSDLGARLYEAVGGTLREVHDGTFPLPAPGGPDVRTAAPLPAMSLAARHSALIHAAASSLDRRERRLPARLVVIGRRRDLRQFAKFASTPCATIPRTRAANSRSRLAGVVRRHLAAHPVTPASNAAPATR